MDIHGVRRPFRFGGDQSASVEGCQCVSADAWLSQNPDEQRWLK
jgi:hypothetical protein